MKYAAAIVSLLLLVGALAWLLLGGDEEADGPSDVIPGAGRAAEAPEGELTGETAHLAGRERANGRGGRRYPPGRSPFKRVVLRTGTLEVLPLGPDDLPIPIDDAEVKVLTSQTVSGGVSGLRNRETGVWTYKDVPIGRVRVVVFGDHIAEHEERAFVREGVTTRVEPSVQRGGALHYLVEHADGTVPERVTLQLINHQGIASAVRWQVRTKDFMTTALRGKKVTLGPDGHVFAIRPGEYTLKVSAPNGETAQAAVVLAPGDSEEMRLVLRR